MVSVSAYLNKVISIVSFSFVGAGHFLLSGRSAQNNLSMITAP